jgi:hypothetical protein
MYEACMMHAHDAFIHSVLQGSEKEKTSVHRDLQERLKAVFNNEDNGGRAQQTECCVEA